MVPPQILKEKHQLLALWWSTWDLKGLAAFVVFVSSRTWQDTHLGLEQHL